MDVLWWAMFGVSAVVALAACVFLTLWQQAKSQLRWLKAEREGLARERDEEQSARYDSQKKLALVEQQVNLLNQEMARRQKLQEEMTQAAKASVLSAGHELSSKLLTDHKRELETAKKDSEERTKKAAEQLNEQFKTITDKVAALAGSNVKQDEKLATLWRSLSTPAGAGALAEVGLENALKNLALEPGRDFIMQYSMTSEDGVRLRPDCIIFLPQNHVMVIDSKASKFVLELAQAEGNPEQYKIAQERFVRSMNEHLRVLAQKDYEGAVRKYYKAAGYEHDIAHIYNVMYLPTEAAYAHIREADPLFHNKAEEKGLILAAPSNLFGLLSVAKIQIVQGKQAESQKEIKNVLENLMDALAVSFGHISKVGDAIRSSAKNFDAFARSANKNVLPKLTHLHRLGVHHAKQRDLPKRLASYEIYASDDPLLLEGEELAPIKQEETEAA